MVSLICVYNRRAEYEKMVQSATTQLEELEIIPVKNDDHRFSSAAAALNWGAKKSCGEYLVFAHQDVLFTAVDSIRRMVDALREREADRCIVGQFGAPSKGNVTKDGLMEQAALDECCIAMTRSTWVQFPFDEDLCDGWHLYVAEQCLRLRRGGGRVYSADFGVHHSSTGNVDDAYMKTYKRLMIHYPEEKRIITTCKKMPNSLVYYHLYWVLWKTKKCLLGNYNLMYKIKAFFGKGKR